MDLIEAVRQNNPDEVHRLLSLLKTDPERNRKINDGDKERGGSALVWAAADGRLEFIPLLLDARADVNQLSTTGHTPMLVAAQNGHMAVITALIAAGANVNTADKYGRTPVHTAAYSGHAAAITALVAAGANVHTANEDGRTAVLAAAYNGHATAITALVAAGANVNTANVDGATPMFAAAQQGHEAAITALLAAGANVNTPKNTGETPLLMAAQDGHMAAITALLAAGANVNTPLNTGSTPLLMAAQDGHMTAIAALIAAGANVDSADKYGRTPVHTAALNGHAAAITALVAAGANVNTANVDGATPIFVAAQEGHAAAITALLAAGANVNTPLNTGATPLFMAAQDGHIAAITALLAAGANVDTADNDDRTPVFTAAFDGHAEAITALVAAGANVNTGNVSGATPIHMAAHGGHVAAIAALIAAGAKVDIANEDAVTPVYAAALSGHAAAITALIAAGANVNTASVDGATPMFVAAQEGHEASITALLAAGANVNTPLNTGETPLFVAAHNGYMAVITALIAAGANVDAADRDGRTPVFTASFYGYAEAITALVAAGANVNTADVNGTTPVLIAALNGFAAAVAALLEAGADATIKTQDGTALEAAKVGELPGHVEVVKLLEAHFKQYPNGVRSLEAPSASEVKTVSIANPTAPSSDNLLLQSLQLQLLKQEEKCKTDADAARETLRMFVHDLQENDKETRTLTMSSRELKEQSDDIQASLRSELLVQRSEYTQLQQQQQALQTQLAELEAKSRGNGSDTSSEAALQPLRSQLVAVQAQQSILWDEYSIKSQKREALARFQRHANLLLFYRTVHVKLEEIFISFKAVAGGFVNPTDGNLNVAKSVFDAIGDAASIAPLIGTAVDKALKWSVSKGLATLDRARQKNTAIRASELVTLSEVKKYAESIARQLTERYADQLERLATAEEDQALTHKLKKGLGIGKMKEAVLKDMYVAPAKQFAAFGVLWIVDLLNDVTSANIESTELDELVLSLIGQKRPASGLKECWQLITTRLGIDGVRSKSGEVWHPEAVYTLAGIRTREDEYYSASTLQPQKYGWRLGIAQDALLLNLKQVPTPSIQAFVVQHQAAVESIASGKHSKEMKQKVEHQGARLEKLEKTNQIVEGARLMALQQENESLKQRMERIEREDASKQLEVLRQEIQSLKSNSGADVVGRRRPSGIKSFVKEDERANMMDALRELRKFFIGQRDQGEESANIETYEKYLQMANEDAELIYQQENGKHVLCIDGHVLDAQAAAQALWKMIKGESV